MKIGTREIGGSSGTYIIAEVAQSHDGSLGLAYSFIDAVAESGADAIKFQTHIASEESTLDEPFRVKFSKQDATRYDYWKRMEFTREQWFDLASYAESKGITLLSSPFSVAALDLLKEIGVPAWKVGSGEVKSTDLLDRMVESRLPILLSTGMSGYAEIEQIVEELEVKDVDLVLMQCTSKYPTPMESVGLNVLEEFRSRYDCLVGLSDHSGSKAPSMIAISRGCDVLEVHVTFSKKMFGPDVPASLTFEELEEVCSFRDVVEVLNANPVDKDEMSIELKELKAMFGKSLALKNSLPAGTVLEERMLTLKKPASGIPFSDMRKVIGKVLLKDVDCNRLLRVEDLNA